MTRLHHLPATLLIALLLTAAGCQSRPDAQAPTPADELRQRAESSLAEGLRLYEDGHYYLAEEQLLAADIWASTPDLQLQAAKYLAFSYCVSERPNQCRFAFERALQIDPDFRLDNAEAGHPLWGPVFAQVRQR
ncbi:tetratricopeptide (TPR) repeat protein [Pseudomonas nitritireducens]|uniref:Tetratricopeptide (TPR) repeat protein n=1 Tax=Pseudomonas nitroreducens TaxID=46680 RepID=A0A7W7P0V9_PSENT|nr:TssQ family T6SS-associated lipoprotein [Pseudomonas nitritireducens]MBB4862790.1 tetratricopeptide (TPR) repeat protein [Pseudomonas nitritireducens]